MSQMRTTMKSRYCRIWLVRKGWGGFCLVFWRKGKGEVLLLSISVWWKGTEKTKLDSSEVCSDSTRGNSCKSQERKSQLGVRKIIFTMRVGQTFWTGGQRGCEVFICGDIQSWARQGPEQPDPHWPDPMRSWARWSPKVPSKLHIFRFIKKQTNKPTL